MLQRGRDQETDRAGHGQERKGVQEPQATAQLPEAFLECRVEVKAKKNLRAENEQPSLAKRGLQSFSDLAAHDLWPGVRPGSLSNGTAVRCVLRPTAPAGARLCRLAPCTLTWQAPIWWWPCRT